MSGTESRRLSSGGSWRGAEPPRGPGLVCQMGSTSAFGILLCWQRPSNLPAWISLARPYLLPRTESLPLTETNQQHSQEQSKPKAISSWHYKRGWDLAHIVHFSGVPKDTMASNPIASQHHRGCMPMHACVCVRTPCWGCPQTVLHVRVSTGVSRYPVNNLIYTTSKWEINSGNYPISSILICHWL